MTLVEYLQSQPDDYVINWHCDSMTRDKAWDFYWVDVLVEDNLAWVITSGLYNTEDDKEYVSPAENEIVWPPDLVAHLLIDPELVEPYAGIMPLELGEPVDEEALAEIRWAQGQVSKRAYWAGAPAWSATEINRAIEDWCIRYVGRPMQARWDVDHGPSPELAEAMELMEAMKSGIEPSYLLKPGEAEGGEGVAVYASEQVMEMLMQDLVDEDE